MRIARGENDSVTTSAQRTRSNTTSRASGFDRSSARPSLPAFNEWYWSADSTLCDASFNGATTRSTSTLCDVSILTTVAP